MQTRPDIQLIINEFQKTSIKINDEQNPIENRYSLIKEEIIAKNLDICITNKLLEQIPLDILIRIVTSPKKVVKNHHLLFRFICDFLKTKQGQKLSSEDEEILSILPSCLDYCLMSNEEIEELIEIEIERYFISPKNVEKKMKSLISSEKEIKKQFENVERRLSEIESNYKKEISELRRMIDSSNSLHSEMTLYQSKIEQKVNDQASLIDKNKTEISEIKSNAKKDHNELKNSIESLKKSFLEIDKKSDSNLLDLTNGIFNDIYKKYPDPFKDGLIEIEGKSSGQYHHVKLPKIIDPNWRSDFWCSENVENSCIIFKFKMFSVLIHKYRLRVGHPDGSYALINWVLSGITLDNQEIALDEVNNSSEITKSHPETSRSLQTQKWLKSIKLKMKGTNTSGTYQLILRNVELFGTIDFNKNS